MSAASAHLTLRPERCNECGACVPACPYGAIRVGDTYILVDWHTCNHCCACVDACPRHAIQRETVAPRSSAVPAVTLGDVSKVVVGSRAEAKAVRKAATHAAKQVSKASAKPAARPASASSGSGAGVVELRAARDARAVAKPAAKAAESADSAKKATAAPSVRALGGSRWTLIDAALVLALLLLTLVGKNAVMEIPAIALMPASGRAFTRAGILAVYYAVQLAALVLLAGRHGTSLMPAFGLRRDQDAKEREDVPAERPSAIGSAGLAVALFGAVEVVAIGYGLTMQALGIRETVTVTGDVASVFGGGQTGLILAVLLVALIAPFIEELAFRGVILAALGDRLGMWPAIVISAVLFAGFHPNAWLFFPMLVFGVALGWLAWSRRSLWPAIAMHMLYNGLAVVAAFTVPR